MHYTKSLLNLLLIHVVGNVGVIEALLPLVCFVVFILDQELLSIYPVIIAKLAISFYISFYSWDPANILFMCVQAMKQRMIESFGDFFSSLLCTLCLSF
jgi:hypothetical protein